MLFRRQKADQAARLRRDGTFEERYRLTLRYAANGVSFLALYEGWEYFHAPAHEGFVAFERHNGVAVACGDPVSPPGLEASTLAAFLDWCRAERLTPAFANALEESLPLYREAGLTAVKVGEEPLFDTATYAPRGDRPKKVRSAVNQARKNGGTVEVIPAGVRPRPAVANEIEEVIREWRVSRQVKALGFTLRLSPLVLVEDKILLIARSADGRMEAFLTGLPYDGGRSCYFEDIIRRPGAPNGLSEMLILKAIEECRARGITTANLGLAPLRGSRQQPSPRPLLGRLLDFTSRRLNFFYRFQPLEHFKAKFCPSGWQNAYLVYPPRRLPRVATGLLLAFTPGTAGPVTTAFSRARSRSEGPEGAESSSLPLIGGLAAVTAAVVGVAVFQPEIIEHSVAEVFRPFSLAGSMVRAHLFIDALLAVAGGGWFIRSRR
jgi:phosphatidylglycerol lysyltransferase